MAKRNSNRNSGRTAEGGLRKTESVRELSRPLARDVTRDPWQGYEFFRPDLSAFETISTPINEIANARVSAPAPARPAQSTISRSPYVAKAGQGATRRTDPPAPVARPRVAELKRPELLRGKAPTPQPARRPDMHEVRSARIEPSRSVCKERPRDTKPRGGGGSRNFIPWCDRKR